MDRVKILAGFKEVFSFLRSDRCNIHDDAILHLFVDSLKSTLTDIESVRECGLIEFLVDIGEQSNSIDDGIVSMALELAGWLGSEEDRFLHFLTPLSNCLRTLWIKVTVNEVSVLSSLFHCLCSLTKHAKGLEWLIQENKDVQEKWLTILETGASIFLQKAVINYVCELCTSPDIKRHTDFLQAIISADILPVVTNCSCALKDGKIYSESKVMLILKLLEDISGSDLVCDIVGTTSVIDELAHIVLNAKRSIAQAALAVLKIYSRKKCKDVADSIDMLVDEMCEQGDILMAQSLVLLRMKSNEQKESIKHKDVFLAPIRCILGEMKHDDQCRSVIPVVKLNEQMSTKHKMTTVICKTLANLSSLKLVVPDVISRLLLATVSDLSPDKSQYLKSNAKVQRSCLHYINDSQDLTIEEDLAIRIVSSIIQIISPTSIDSQTYLACTKCLEHVLPKLVKFQNIEGNIPEKLAFLLQQHLCSLNWEQRDTTLEFLSALIADQKDNMDVIKWLEDHKLHNHIWQCKEDGESYVRATTLACLYSVSTCSQLWVSLLNQVGLSEKEVINTVCDILKSDTEAFPRRSAAKLLHRFYFDKMDNSLDDTLQNVVQTMVRGIHDFDWEVKLHVLGFIEELLEKDIRLSEQTADKPHCARSLSALSETDNTQSKDFEVVVKTLRTYFETGCLQALFVGLDDYDLKVSEKAVFVIDKLRRKLKCLVGSDETLEADFLKSAAKVSNDANTDGKNDAFRSLADKNVLLPHISSDRNSADHKSTDRNSEERIFNSSDIASKFNDSRGGNLVECLASVVKFEEARYRHKQVDGNNYMKNPLSIIQDILSYGQKSEDDNVVDCY